MTLDIMWVKAWVARMAEAASAHRDELIDLDRAIGDGDHGENLDRGFAEVMKQMESAPDDPAQVLRTVGMTLVTKVGGASGPLYGTAFMNMSSVAKAQMEAADIVALIDAGLAGVQKRGKAEPGEKTMVDAWEPARRAAVAAADSGADARGVLEAAAQAAHEGAQATLDMVATKGRASYLGDRSVGHLDPGAVSTSYILEAAVKAAQ
ncbi:dihydroxyacetone kinase subunit L [Arcanobacterium haemolyticum]|nr:dihydroxyacetone kinase subunit L [Arcanobacterium haemolyticum]